AASLRKGGDLWLVANRHLPYEAILNEQFAKVRLAGETNGYKVYEARK
ncbi:MAG TPA: methyltransferase, partial [Caulobacter sp.]|nr:methyltransferase [Caulobacter sp.]